MKTLTLHINDDIYEDVKKFLALFSPEKIRIENYSEKGTILSASYLNRDDVNKMIALFKKLDIPIPKNLNKIPSVYNEDDLNTDMENLKKLKFAVD